MKNYFLFLTICIFFSCEDKKSTSVDELDYSDITFIKDFSSYTNCGFKLDVKQTI